MSVKWILMVLPLQWHAERYLYQQAVKVVRDLRLQYVQANPCHACRLQDQVEFLTSY